MAGQISNRTPPSIRSAQIAVTAMHEPFGPCLLGDIGGTNARFAWQRTHYFDEVKFIGN
jgi:hypothetical protein